MDATIECIIIRTVALFACLSSSTDPSIKKFFKIFLKMDFKSKPEIFFASVDELKLCYPEFVYSEDMRDTTDIFHDLEKKVTPYFEKNDLKYKWKDLAIEMNSELTRLLSMRNAIKVILCIKPSRVKGFVLKLLSIIFNVDLCGGGGASPLTKRVSIIYHKESGTKPQKRMSKYMKEALDVLRERPFTDSEDEKEMDKLSAGQSSNEDTVTASRTSITVQTPNPTSTITANRVDSSQYDASDERDNNGQLASVATGSSAPLSIVPVGAAVEANVERDNNGQLASEAPGCSSLEGVFCEDYNSEDSDSLDMEKLRALLGDMAGRSVSCVHPNVFSEDSSPETTVVSSVASSAGASPVTTSIVVDPAEVYMGCSAASSAPTSSATSLVVDAAISSAADSSQKSDAATPDTPSCGSSSAAKSTKGSVTMLVNDPLFSNSEMESEPCCDVALAVASQHENCASSADPSAQPSGMPSMQPSSRPSGLPTGQPTSDPSNQPSARPSLSSIPSSLPSDKQQVQTKGDKRRQLFGEPSSPPTSRDVKKSKT